MASKTIHANLDRKGLDAQAGEVDFQQLTSKDPGLDWGLLREVDPDITG